MQLIVIICFLYVLVGVLKLIVVFERTKQIQEELGIVKKEYSIYEKALQIFEAAFSAIPFFLVFHPFIGISKEELKKYSLKIKQKQDGN